MSSTSIFPSSLAITGGIPTKGQDLAASIVFAAFYFLLVPVAIFRLAKRESRCWALLRPAIFILARIVTFIFRAIQANGNYAKSLFIGEQILLLCGFVLLCEPLLTLLGYHITRNSPPSAGKGNLLVRVQLLLKTALVVALILGVYAGSQFSDLNDSSTLKTVKATRDSNAIICTVVTVLAIGVAIFAQLVESPRLPVKFTAFITICGALLSVSSIYRIVLYERHAPNPINVDTKIAFYFLFALPEALVAASYLSINLNAAFNIEEGRDKERISKEMKKGTYNGNYSGAGQGYPPQAQTQWA
ncbi:hypothetical protein P7C70_g8359, partial [Phenoliferia sp. Uapishka_3]